MRKKTKEIKEKEKKASLLSRTLQGTADKGKRQTGTCLF